MFIVSLTYRVPIEQIERYLAEHIEYLDEQYRSGYFQLSGRKVPRTGGIILATVEKREKLDLILAKDPFYREALASYEVTEVVPTRTAPGLEFLVGK